MRTIVLVRSCALVCLLSAPALAEEPPPAPPPAPYEVPPSPPPPPPAVPAFAAPAPGPERDARSAAPTSSQRSVQVDVGVATDFPISMGGYVGLEVPGRILLQVGAGVMPGAYSGAINGVLTSAGAYDATVGNFLQNALSNSFVLRLSGGWRPFPDHGLEILAGYTLMTMGGSTTEGDVINAALTEAHATQRVPAGSGITIPLSATLHNVHATLGWRWLLASDHLVIRASLSYLQCLAASVNVGLPGQGQAMETAVNQQLNAQVAPYFTSYVKVPLVGLSAGYRF